MGRAVREDAAAVKAAASVHDGGAGVVLRHRLWRVEALPPHFDDNGALRVAGWARRGVSAAAAAAAGASSCEGQPVRARVFGRESKECSWWSANEFSSRAVGIGKADGSP